MSHTQVQIQRLSKLTSLTPPTDLEISSVLDSFDSLSQTDTSGVDTISRSGRQIMSPRPDIIREDGLSSELLATSHQKKAARQIVLGGIMIGE